MPSPRPSHETETPGPQQGFDSVHTVHQPMPPLMPAHTPEPTGPQKRFDAAFQPIPPVTPGPTTESPGLQQGLVVLSKDSLTPKSAPIQHTPQLSLTCPTTAKPGDSMLPCQDVEMGPPEPVCRARVMPRRQGRSSQLAVEMDWEEVVTYRSLHRLVKLNMISKYLWF